jgi:hypothetical protein
MVEAIIVNDGQSPDTTNDRQIPIITFLDDARSEIAKIGAQGVKGVRVVSAKVNEQDADVHLVVDVEYRKDLSEAIIDVQNKVSQNLARHLPNGKGQELSGHGPDSPFYLAGEDLLGQLLEPRLKPGEFDRWAAPPPTLAAFGGRVLACLGVGRIMPPTVGLRRFYGYRTR